MVPGLGLSLAIHRPATLEVRTAGTELPEINNRAGWPSSSLKAT